MKHYLTFESLARQNTGMSILDSGGKTGRQWQRPLPKEKLEIEVTEKSIYGTISLCSFLNSRLSIDRKLSKWIQNLDGLDLSDEKLIANITEKINTPFKSRGYTYNFDTDLSQNFIYMIFSWKDDYMYDNNAIVCIRTHNGADARGGFSTIILARLKESISSLFENNITWFVEASNTSYSTSELNDSIIKVYGKRKNYIIAKLIIGGKEKKTLIYPNDI